MTASKAKLDAVIASVGSVLIGKEPEVRIALACLLANHGQLATGFKLDGALKLAELVEEVAQWYWGVLAMGCEPKLLDHHQMDEVLTAFASYGQQAKRGDLAAGNKLDK